MEGLIYYNIGLKCLTRLAVSVSTAIRHFKGEITILADGDCLPQCQQIGKQFNVKVQAVSSDDFIGHNFALLNKCRLHRVTPYQKTLFVDSDTIILRDFSECFKMLDEYEFIVPQFCTWKSRGGHYRHRIELWKGFVSDELMACAFDEPAAVNIGFYGWRTGAKIFDEWFNTALKNRMSFIPDEIACQILLPHYNHLILGSEYNTSCKYEQVTEQTRTLHFHGRKHCRLENGQYLYQANRWYDEFNKVRDIPCVKDNIEHDNQLRKYLPEYDKCQSR